MKLTRLFWISFAYVACLWCMLRNTHGWCCTVPWAGYAGGRPCCGEASFRWVFAAGVGERGCESASPSEGNPDTQDCLPCDVEPGNSFLPPERDSSFLLERKHAALDQKLPNSKHNNRGTKTPIHYSVFKETEKKSKNKLGFLFHFLFSLLHRACCRVNHYTNHCTYINFIKFYTLTFRRLMSTIVDVPHR